MLAHQEGHRPRARDVVAGTQDYAVSQLQASLGVQGVTITIKRSREVPHRCSDHGMLRP
jgi:hypothetical protein